MQIYTHTCGRFREGFGKGGCAVRISRLHQNLLPRRNWRSWGGLDVRPNSSNPGRADGLRALPLRWLLEAKETENERKYVRHKLNLCIKRTRNVKVMKRCSQASSLFVGEQLFSSRASLSVQPLFCPWWPFLSSSCLDSLSAAGVWHFAPDLIYSSAVERENPRKEGLLNFVCKTMTFQFLAFFIFFHIIKSFLNLKIIQINAIWFDILL